MPIVVLAVLAALVALLPAAVPWLRFVFIITIASGFAALGVAVLLRAGLISIGHALFYAVGAYAVAFLMRATGTTDLFLLLAAAVVVSGLAGLVVGAFMVRYRAIFFAMLNLAVSMVVFSLLSKLYGLTGGSDGMRVATPTLVGSALDREAFNAVFLYVVIGLFVAAGILVQLYFRSPMGEALAAVETNEVRLEYLGVSVRGVLLSAYVLSAMLAGLGGAIAGIAIGHVVPEMAYWTESGHFVLVAVLGGIAGPAGPFIGAIFLEVLRTLASGFAAETWNLVVGVALLLVIFFLPEGLYGIGAKLFRRRGAQ
ncbi:branched-chain amino acid ABC transporter permease [Propylenella binzhouense]|uniref:Branched-chain amino acid ABC transporter permease n=1 Tax=Propylenella binzhouense TaxID=2555902 RepID=A0A964WSW2_9HYPH|nr:branched-chain amino acid ABC transporter permease [Propylenella binzhouense]MYZ47389.1 branched-chain amino acid ABC transporter permease [Propylenella binzhouense]